MPRRGSPAATWPSRAGSAWACGACTACRWRRLAARSAPGRRVPGRGSGAIAAGRVVCRAQGPGARAAQSPGRAQGRRAAAGAPRASTATPSGELTALIESEVGRLSALLDRLLSPRRRARTRRSTSMRCSSGCAPGRGRGRLVGAPGARLRPQPARAAPAMPTAWCRRCGTWCATRSRPAPRPSPCAPVPSTACASASAARLALRLEIVDDGRGVPEELAERLFLPLVSGRAEGSGLGLALAQQVAREHRGSLAYRSRAGHTVFTLLLPLPWAERAGAIEPVGCCDEARDLGHRRRPLVRFVLAERCARPATRCAGSTAARRSTALAARRARPAVHRRAHARRRRPGKLLDKLKAASRSCR
jgi:hypothetical protein